VKQFYEIIRLPELTAENLDLIMQQRLDATRNTSTIIPMLWQGLLEMPLFVNGRERTAKYYIPKNTPQGSPIVIMNVPEKEETVPFLNRSGWLTLADQERFCLFVLEPGSEGWGSPDEEFPYLQEGVRAQMLGQYCLAAFAPYVAGYGPIGVGLQKIIMADPLHTAAAVFLDASNVDKQYRAEYLQNEYQMQDPYNPAEKSLKVPYREIPVPVWIASETIDEDTEAMLAYWKNAAVADTAVQHDSWGTVYTQSRPCAYTPQGNILQVAVQAQSYDFDCPATTEKIYTFLKQYYRYGMGPRSNMISNRVDLEAKQTVHRRFTDSNGIDREYLVYFPPAYRNSGKKLPMVVAYHGASQSMRNMMANGLWYDLADQEGIILVYPESTLVPLLPELSGGKPFAYRPLWSLNEEDAHTEASYANELLDHVIAEFPVDEQRIYCTGHSMGCMMTNYLGSTAVSHRFAAVGATSGILRTRNYTGTQPLPAFMTVGQFELWNYLIDVDSAVTAQIDMWLIRNGLATEETVRRVRVCGASDIYKEGNYNNYIWDDAAGIPWVRYAWISDKHHVHTPGESRIFWKQWFSKWHLTEENVRCYDGSPV